VLFTRFDVSPHEMLSRFTGEEPLTGRRTEVRPGSVDMVIAEDSSGINSGVVAYRASPEILAFLERVDGSPYWQLADLVKSELVWHEQTQFFVEMLRDS